MKFYFDTSAYIKLRHTENGSDVVEEIVLNNEGNLCFSWLLFTEIHSALFIKV